MSVSIFYAILVTSLATFISRFLGAVSSQGIKETSKLFKWFNCLAYATLAALIARIDLYPLKKNCLFIISHQGIVDQHQDF
ncbi:AzlD domain-containing protein [Candidatus Pelagibacter sp.]|nr:AzlD domain-containing protein [Candidatus Pelagibacter sp.]